MKCKYKFIMLPSPPPTPHSLHMKFLSSLSVFFSFNPKFQYNNIFIFHPFSISSQFLAFFYCFFYFDYTKTNLLFIIYLNCAHFLPFWYARRLKNSILIKQEEEKKRSACYKLNFFFFYLESMKLSWASFENSPANVYVRSSLFRDFTKYVVVVFLSLSSLNSYHLARFKVSSLSFDIKKKKSHHLI